MNDLLQNSPSQPDRTMGVHIKRDRTRTRTRTRTGFRTTAWQRDASAGNWPLIGRAMERAKAHRNRARDPKDWREMYFS